MEITLRWVVVTAFAAISLVFLAASGMAKLADPDPTTGAMRAAGLPNGKTITRLLALAEITSVVTGLAIGGPWLIPALALYLGFFVFTVRALRSSTPLQSCGCFGRDDTPPTLSHVVYNGMATLALGYLSVVDDAPIPWSEDPLRVLLYVAFATVGAYLSYLLLARLPQTLRMTRTP